MILDDYEKELFYNLENVIGDFNWYTIKYDRKDRKRFVETIKKRIEYYDDYELNEDHTKFRRREPFKKENYPMHGQITYTIEWRNQSEVDIDYSHLPEPVFTPTNKIVKRRAQ